MMHDTNERNRQCRKIDGDGHSTTTGNPYAGIGADNAQALRNMNSAQSNIDRNKNALRLSEHFLEISSDQDFSTLDEVVNEFNLNIDEADETETAAKGEELAALFIEHAQFLNDNVNSLKAPHNLLAVSTKVYYFGKLKGIVKSKMPDLTIWKDHDAGRDSGWYLCLRAKVERKGACTFFQNEEDDVDLSPKCCALVIQSSTEKMCQECEQIWLEMDSTDLESIVKNFLLKSNDSKKFELRAMLVMLYYATGRGGDLNFIHWELVIWDCMVDKDEDCY